MWRRDIAESDAFGIEYFTLQYVHPLSTPPNANRSPLVIHIFWDCLVCPELSHTQAVIYQLAFFTPGRFPASAFNRNWYYKVILVSVIILRK